VAVKALVADAAAVKALVADAAAVKALVADAAAVKALVCCGGYGGMPAARRVSGPAGAGQRIGHGAIIIITAPLCPVVGMVFTEQIAHEGARVGICCHGAPATLSQGEVHHLSRVSKKHLCGGGSLSTTTRGARNFARRVSLLRIAVLTAVPLISTARRRALWRRRRRRSVMMMMMMMTMRRRRMRR
jgi:hypothetical protein